MKKVAIGILIVAVLACGGMYRLYTQEAHKAAQAQAALETLRQQTADLQASLEKQEKRTQQLTQELGQTRSDPVQQTQTTEVLRLRNEVTGLKAITNAAAKPSNPMADMFNEMSKNPEMREAIKTQQKNALSLMNEKQYGRLYSDLHLSPEQSAALKDLIVNKQLSAAEVGMSMLGGDLDASKRAELMQQVKTASDAVDAQIKEFLGDDNFAQYKNYEKTLNERMTISSFKDQLGSGPAALGKEQEDQLIQVMTQERQNFKFTTDYADQTKLAGDPAMFSEDRLNGYIEQLGQLNQQYLAKAKGILSQDQLTVFQKYLTDQQALQKMGVQMAAKMLGPKGK